MTPKDPAPANPWPPMDESGSHSPLAETIREEMAARGWSEEWVAQRMGDPVTAVAFEMLMAAHHDRMRLDNDMAERLARVFGVSPQLFLNLDETTRQIGYAMAPAPAPAGEAATTDESEGPWGTAQTDVARRALAAAPVSPPPATDPVLRARLARALSSLASMRAWHSLYHGRDPCALCVDADGCLTREGVAVPEDWRPDVYYRLAGTEMEILPPPPRQDRGGTGGAE